jgi:hypothetical protein
LRRHFRQILTRGATKFSRQIGGHFSVRVVNRGHMKVSIFQPARHVRAHSSDANETSVHDDNVSDIR